jgi:hypothetical protein
MRDGKLCLAEGKAKTVRLIFKLARDGYGIVAITERLNRGGVKPIARASHWARAYVAKILTSRAVTGEYQPFTRRGGKKRRPDGEPIPNYFPAVIAEDEWHAVQAAVAARRNKPGRPAKAGVNIFQGLLRDARDGATLRIANKSNKPGGQTLISAAAVNGLPGSRAVSFPFVTFERAFLALLREIDPREVIGEDRHADEVMALTGELGGVDARIAKLEAELLEGDVPSLARALRGLEERRGDLTARLAAARARAAEPAAAAWGEARSLLGALDGAEDVADCRTRLRGALRRIVSEVWCLFVPAGRWRLAAVQVFFAGGEQRRDYLILHQPAHHGYEGRQEGGWWARSLADVTRLGPLDLRKRAYADRLERLLETIDLAALTGCP